MKILNKVCLVIFALSFISSCGQKGQKVAAITPGLFQGKTFIGQAQVSNGQLLNNVQLHVVTDFAQSTQGMVSVNGFSSTQFTGQSANNQLTIEIYNQSGTLGSCAGKLIGTLIQNKDYIAGTLICSSDQTDSSAGDVHVFLKETLEKQPVVISETYTSPYFGTAQVDTGQILTNVKMTVVKDLLKGTVSGDFKVSGFLSTSFSGKFYNNQITISADNKNGTLGSCSEQLVGTLVVESNSLNGTLFCGDKTKQTLGVSSGNVQLDLYLGSYPPKEVLPPFGIEVADVLTFKVGQESKYKIIGRVPTGSPVMEILNLPKGVQFDKNTFELTWNPTEEVLTGENDSQLSIKTFSVMIELRSSNDKITSVTKNIILVVTE